MVQDYTNDYLKMLKTKILASNITENDIIDFVSTVQQIQTFETSEIKLLTLEIYILLKHINNFIPLIDLTLNTIPAKIILDSNENKKEDNCDIEKSCCAPIATEQNNLSQLEKELIAKWSPFKKEENPDLKLPAKGELGNVQIEDREIREGKIYYADVMVDHEGNIVFFKSGPTEIMEAKDYETIYAGLVGQLFDFQTA